MRQLGYTRQERTLGKLSLCAIDRRTTLGVRGIYARNIGVWTENVFRVIGVRAVIK